MLILTRKEGDALLLEMKDGTTVEIRVTELTPGQVRLGIEAPADCKIWRKELYATVQQNRAAASAPAVEQLKAMLRGSE